MQYCWNITYTLKMLLYILTEKDQKDITVSVHLPCLGFFVSHLFKWKSKDEFQTANYYDKNHKKTASDSSLSKYGCSDTHVRVPHIISSFFRKTETNKQTTPPEQCNRLIQCLFNPISCKCFQNNFTSKICLRVHTPRGRMLGYSLKH